MATSTTSTPVVARPRRRHSRAFLDALAELRFWQGQVKMEERWVRLSRARAREAAARLREIQGRDKDKGK